VAKSEAGLSHFEGQNYVGLMRHMIPTPIVEVIRYHQRRNAKAAQSHKKKRLEAII